MTLLSTAWARGPALPSQALGVGSLTQSGLPFFFCGIQAEALGQKGRNLPHLDSLSLLQGAFGNVPIPPGASVFPSANWGVQEAV